MNAPCLVEWDLYRHLHQLDAEAAREDRLQELLEERRRYLTTSRPGFSLVTEALYVEEPGYPLDEALFALYGAWQRREPLEAPVAGLMRVLADQADRMAQRWAEWTLSPAAREADAEDVPF